MQPPPRSKLNRNAKSYQPGMQPSMQLAGPQQWTKSQAQDLLPPQGGNLPPKNAQHQKKPKSGGYGAPEPNYKPDSLVPTRGLHASYWTGFGSSDTTHLNGCMMFIVSESYGHVGAFPESLSKALEISLLKLQTLYCDHKHPGPLVHYNFSCTNSLRISVPFWLRRKVLDYFDQQKSGRILTPTGWQPPCDIDMSFPRERVNEQDPWLPEKYSKIIITEPLHYLYIESCRHVFVNSPGVAEHFNLRLRLVGIGDLTLASDKSPLISDRNVWLTLYMDGKLTETESAAVRFLVKFPADGGDATTLGVLQFTLQGGIRINTHLCVATSRLQPGVDVDRKLQDFLESKGVEQVAYPNSPPVPEATAAPDMPGRSPAGDEHIPPNLGALGGQNTFFGTPVSPPGGGEPDAELEALLKEIIETP